jgi:hypothetical protein
MSTQEFTLQGTPRYKVGEHIYGFNFVTGELRGKIVEVKPCLIFAYVLEGGAELGPYDDIYDDIYGRCDEQGERVR